MQETIRDLLVTDATAQPSVHIREVAGGGVCLAGAQEQEVGSQADMAAILEQVHTAAGRHQRHSSLLFLLLARWGETAGTHVLQGTLMRATAATGMNRHSSRSHAVFTITLEQRRQVS
jgi:Kinesin motor domain